MILQLTKLLMHKCINVSNLKLIHYFTKDLDATWYYAFMKEKQEAITLSLHG